LGIDLEAYLRDALVRIHVTPADRIGELTSSAWLAAQ